MERCVSPQAAAADKWRSLDRLAAAFTISKTSYFALLMLIICGGGFLRFYPTSSFQQLGYDEAIYERYVSYLDRISLLDYPAVCQHYISIQEHSDLAVLPPTRFCYVYAAHLWRRATGEPPHGALTHVSALFSLLTLVLTAAFCFRLSGAVASVGVTALMSVTMNQIHQSQHAMIDGFFTFWTLVVVWALWENLRHPRHAAWLAIYAVALVVVVTTKENAFFVFVAVCGLLVVNRWLSFGTATPSLVLVTLGAGLTGFAAMVLLAGGIDVLVQMYRLLVAKSAVLPYAILNGDGPWYRYLVDLTLVSPLVVLLATGATFQLTRHDKAPLFLLIFVACTFAVMANVKLGCNLRYATIWDMPLRLLAFSQLCLLAGKFGVRRHLVLTFATIALCGFELRQYFVFCVHWPAYALVPGELLRATHIIK